MTEQDHQRIGELERQIAVLAERLENHMRLGESRAAVLQLQLSKVKDKLDGVVVAGAKVSGVRALLFVVLSGSLGSLGVWLAQKLLHGPGP